MIFCALVVVRSVDNFFLKMLCMPHRKLKSDLMLCISPIKLSIRVLTKNTFSLSAAIKKGKNVN